MRVGFREQVTGLRLGPRVGLRRARGLGPRKAASLKGSALGFTLVEMMVSLSIFAVMTGFLMANFRVGRLEEELRASVNMSMATVRQAQTRALAGAVTNVCRGGSNDLKLCPTGAGGCPGGICTSEVPLGYGVRFTTAGDGRQQAVLFADANGNRVLDGGETISGVTVSSTPKLYVSALSPVSGSSLDIVFVPPRPTVYFNGDTATGVGTVFFYHATTSRSRSFSVNRVSGQVSAN